MDEFGCLDYKKPPNSVVPDMRTSTYRGHRHITDVRLGNKLNAKFPNKNIYVRDPLLHEKQFSEYGANYEWKYGDPNILRNPSLNMNIQFMKPFEQGKIRFVKRKMKPMSSVSMDTYTPKDLPLEEDPLPLTMPTPVQSTKLIIDRSKTGYSKYLDPSATTYNLSYVRYNPKELQAGVAAHDNVTFWNWNEHMPAGKKVTREPDENMCDTTAAKKCPKRILEYQNQTKRVPNTGMKTEVRDNYKDPRFDSMDYDLSDVKPILLHEPITPFAKKSEYAIYGSGEPVLKYV
ncbi:uncharacterized protein [Drosophila tropicalis]|uniref:uncharacterized protein n=1 Tax=Drosophila tropicalis TaxID=46794 RepID=UPI0035AC2146